jgi:predicted chitinase
MRITRKINGGTNGYADRLGRYETAMNVLKEDVA